MGELAILQWQDLTQSGEPDQIQVCNARTFEVLSTHEYIARGDGETDVVVVGGKLIKVARVDEEGNHSESIVTSWSSSSGRAYPEHLPSILAVRGDFRGNRQCSAFISDRTFDPAACICFASTHLPLAREYERYWKPDWTGVTGLVV